MSGGRGGATLPLCSSTYVPLCSHKIQITTTKHQSNTTMNSSLELAYQMRRLSTDSTSTLGSSSSIGTFDSSAFEQQVMTPSPSYTSYNSLSSNQTPSQQATAKGLSRSRCIHSNLSALGSSSSADSFGSLSSARQIPSYASSPNAGEGWGYFVDTPSR